MTTQQQLERTLDLTCNGSPDAQRVLINRLAYATIREMERKIRQQRQEQKEARYDHRDCA